MRQKCIQNGVVCLALLLLVSCGPDIPAPTIDQVEFAASYGEVQLTYVQELSDDPEQAAPFSISARFLRVSDIDRQSVRHLLGEELPETTIDFEECTAIEATSAHQANLLASSLELLDAGELTLRVDQEEVRIPDWSFPSVYGVVAGVLYGGDDSLGVPYRPEREYRIFGSGAGQIGAFEVTLLAPDELTGLLVGGAEPGVEPVLVEGSGPLEVRWESVSDSGAEVISELSWSQFGVEQRALCRSRDDGLIELPPSVVSRLRDPGVVDGRLSLYRATRSSFSTEGLDEGEAVFVVSVVVPLRSN